MGGTLGGILGVSIVGGEGLESLCVFVGGRWGDGRVWYSPGEVRVRSRHTTPHLNGSETWTQRRGSEQITRGFSLDIPPGHPLGRYPWGIP